MTLNRRALVAGAAFAAAAPSILRAETSAARRFRVVRDGDDIGGHLLVVTRSGSDLQVAVDIELKVKILGITAYRYEMENREVWRDGRLISMDSKSNDDGDPAFSRCRAAGGEIEVEGSYWSGTVPGDSATTTYWNKAFLSRRHWISTADGDHLKVQVSEAGAGEIGGLATRMWKVGGDLDIDLHYQGEEWVSVRFDAGGEDAFYVPEAMAPPLAPLWSGA